MKINSVLVLLTICALSMGVGCSGAEENGAEAQKGQIAVSTSIWGEVLSNVVCNDVTEVDVLMGANVDPHSFEPSLADRQMLENADLIVVNGLSLEVGIDDAVATLEGQGKSVFNFSDHTELLEHDEHQEHQEHDGDDEHDQGAFDPHIWLDPNGVRKAIPMLAKEVEDSLQLASGYLDDCVKDYDEKLSQVDAELMSLIGDIDPSKRKMVTNHDAYGYFARRYGVSILGAVIPSLSNFAETNPSELQELADTIESEGVTTIFAEAQMSDDNAKALSEAVGEGVDVVTLFSGALGEPGSGAETYIEMIRTNGRLIAGGME